MPEPKLHLYKAFTICVLTALVYCHAGHYLVMQLVQKQHKEAMKQEVLRRLKAEDLERIAYTGNERQVDWEEEGKEFFYNGSMYDLVHTSSINGITWLYCIKDGAENKLVEDYKAATKNNNENKKIKNDHSVSLFCTTEVCLSIFKYSSKICFPSFSYPLPSVVININAPPPRYAITRI